MYRYLHLIKYVNVISDFQAYVVEAFSRDPDGKLFCDVEGLNDWVTVI
jgi:hypothetical protein